MPTLDFKGKPFVYSHHLSVPFRELVVDAKKSLSAKGQKPSLDDNLIIHGDNLDALKALLPRYAGKVDVIYIDPPYNTGNEGWAYNDNVNSPLMKEWLGKVVDRDDLERHDKWCCMMWPRLQLLNELLSDTGAIFVSIDDNELPSLLALMYEIFGDNYVGTLPVVNNLKGRNDKRNIAQTHEYLVAFDKGKFESRGVPLTAKQLKEFRFVDKKGRRYALRDLRRRGGADRREDREGMFFPLYLNQNTGKLALEREGKNDIKIIPLRSDGSEGRWRWSPTRVKDNLEILTASYVRRSDKWNVSYPVYLDVVDDEDDDQRDIADIGQNDWDDEDETPFDRTTKTKSFWWGPELSTDLASKWLKSIMGKEVKFEYPKSPFLLRKIIHMAASPTSVVLDSFAGSGTTGEAVFALNKSDGGQRKFILVEMQNYADGLTAERVRRVAKGVPHSRDEALKEGFGGSFTFCELGEPLDLDRFFAGKGAPNYEQVAQYIVYTATGRSMSDVPKEPRTDWLIGEVGGYRIHLIYRPDLDFMRGNDAALSMPLAEQIAEAAKGKPVLVYAAAKFMSQRELTSKGITFCQLPYAVYRILGEAPNAS
jgi:DNA modification methylase